MDTPLPAPPPEPPTRSAWRRIPAYGALLVLGLLGTSAALARDPQTEVDTLAELVIERPVGRVFYRYRGASLGLYGDHGYSLTVFVGRTERFAPAKFLIVSRLDGRLQAELLNHHGVAGVARISGARLDAYLKRCRLDLSGIERAHAAWQAQHKSSRR